MARDISATIGLNGEREFTTALKNAESAVKTLDSELKLTDATFKNTGDKQAYMADKSQLLADKLSQQLRIVDALEQAVGEAAEKFGDASTKTDTYRQKLNNAKTAAERIETQLRDLQSEAEETGDDFKSMGGDIESSLQSIDISSKISAMKDMGDTLIGAFEGLVSFVENSEEFRRSMSYLEQNAKTAEAEFAGVRDQLFEVASLTGELDGAFEGLSNLLAAGFDGEEMAEAIDLIAGAVIRFPDTMKFENLSESLQETIGSGEATGAFAELLERFGVDLEAFNKQMAAATTEAEKQNVALSTLAQYGLKEAYDGYVQVNEELIKSEEAQLRMEDASARLGEALVPIATSLQSFGADAMNMAANLIEGGFAGWLEDMAADLASGEWLDNAVKNMIGEEWYNRLFGGERGTAGNYAAGATGYTSGASAQQYAAGFSGGYGAMAQNAAINEAIMNGIDEDLTKSGETAGANAGTAIVTGLTDTLTENAETMGANANTIGQNIDTELANGITAAEATVVNAASGMMDAVQAELNRGLTIPAPTYAGGTQAASSSAIGTGSTVTVVTQIDSQTVARATAGGVSSAQGTSYARASTYGR